MIGDTRGREVREGAAEKPGVGGETNLCARANNQLSSWTREAPTCFTASSRLLGHQIEAPRGRLHGAQDPGQRRVGPEVEERVLHGNDVIHAGERLREPLRGVRVLEAAGHRSGALVRRGRLHALRRARVREDVLGVVRGPLPLGGVPRELLVLRVTRLAEAAEGVGAQGAHGVRVEPHGLVGQHPAHGGGQAAGCALRAPGRLPPHLHASVVRTVVRLQLGAVGPVPGLRGWRAAAGGRLVLLLRTLALAAAHLVEELAYGRRIRHRALALPVGVGMQEHRHGVEASSLCCMCLGNLAHLMDRRLLLLGGHVLKWLPVLRQRAPWAEECRRLLRRLRRLPLL
mmetsp:Transcript_71035/g.183171  ORF Transcript_71035/g.183171 Transcript_71035/m.183171 type:complete len:343 (-) Transcript_71035:572-1600(-)